MRVLLAPLWVRALYWSLLGAIVALVASAFTSESKSPTVLDWPTGMLYFLVFTIGFGALMTWRTQTSRLPFAAQVDGLSPPQRAEAIRAATRGPAPVDPEVLKAALRLGTVYLDQQKANKRRYQVMLAILMTAALLLLVIAAVDGNLLGMAYPVIALIVAPLTKWWNEIVVSRTARQNKVLTQARRTQRKKRV